MYTKNQPTIFKIIIASYLTWKKSLLMTIPFGLISLIAPYMLVPDFVYKQISDQELLDSLSFGLVSRVVLNFIILLMTRISIIYIINNIVVDKKTYLLQTIKLSLKKCLAMLALEIAKLMVTFSPILFFIPKTFLSVFLHSNKLSLYICCLLAMIPGVIINVYFMPAIYLLIIDENNIVSSIKNSFYIISGRWWYMCGVFLITVGISQDIIL